MPAGVDWLPYLKFLSAGLLSMMAGAQLVHWYYKPELLIPKLPPKVGELGEMRDEIKVNLHRRNQILEEIEERSH